MACIELLTSRDTDLIALRGVRVEARVTGLAQVVTVAQTFINNEPKEIEAIYTFPLPASAAVAGFEVITNDRVLTGRVEEIEAAVEKYERAISDGDGAFMVESNRPDVFTVRVGNLKPGDVATIRMTYVAPVDVVDREVRLSFPTTVPPRYATATGTDPLQAMIDADALNPPTRMAVPYGLTVDLHLDLGIDIQAVTSPSHEVIVLPEDGGSHVTLARGLTEMNRDVVVSIELAAEAEPHALMAKPVDPRQDGETFVAVTFVPEFDESDLDQKPATVTFVLDCSGSMAGKKLSQAKRATELCLRALSAGDRFNICAFGSRFRMMAKRPVRYDGESFHEALEFLAAQRDMGGTELLPPLEAIVASGGRDTQEIIVLTDGEVTNEPAVMTLARKHRGQNRIFSFGIGASASSSLVQGLARETGGAAEFIAEGERIEDKVIRTFSRIGSPMVSDVKIDWHADVEQAPEIAPPVFDGDALTVYALVKGTPPRQVTLSCTTAAGPRNWTVQPVRVEDPSEAIAKMWARKQIEQLESATASLRPSMLRRRGKKLQARLIELSKRFGIVCSHTAYIAIEHRSLDDRTSGLPEVRRVPVALEDGWGGLESLDMCMASAPPAGMHVVKYFQVENRPIADLAERRKQKLSARGRRLTGGRQFDHFDPNEDLCLEGGSDFIGALSDVSNDGALGVLGLQRPDGGFDDNDILQGLLREIWQNVEILTVKVATALQAFDPSITETDDLVHTVKVLLLLRKRFRDERSQWSRAAHKATKYVAHRMGIKERELLETLEVLEALPVF